MLRIRVFKTYDHRPPIERQNTMQQNTNRKLTGADIGYHGRPIDTLTREELLDAFIELSQKVYDCASRENKCKDIFTVEN